MKNYPKISIITPNLNQDRYLEACIGSVLGQNYPNLEYIIVDGGSTDKSADIIKKYATQLSYWISERDKGQSEAINKGLKMASGEIVAWLNSDDLYTQGCLHTVAELFEQHADAALVCGHVLNFDDSGSEEIITNDFQLPDFFSRVSLHQPGIFWRKSATKDYPLLDESLHYCMDYDYWMPLFLNHKVINTEKVLARFRKHQGSKTNNNPPGLYLEYRTIVSRFFYSLPGSEWKKRLKNSGIDYHPNGKTYPLNQAFTHNQLKSIFLVYLYRCVEIAYSRGEFVEVLNLFKRNPNLFTHKTSCLFLLKTLSGAIFLRKNRY